MQTKRCRKCEKDLPLDEFYKEKAGKFGRRSKCIECYKAEDRRLYYRDHAKNKKASKKKSKRWRDNHPDKSKEVSKRNQHRYSRQIRQAVLEHLGGCCELCEEEDHRVLHVDHVNGDGSQERKLRDKIAIWRRIVEEDLPGYRLLCANCNHRERVAKLPQPATKAAIYSQRHRLKLKQAAFDCLGDECSRCRENDPVVLCVDHVAGGGNQERSRLINERQLYKNVVKNPGKYQVLCHNCNWVKRHENEEWGK